MKIPVRKGTFELSYIQCGDWRSSHLLSDGLSIEPGQEGATPVITFFIDVSVNLKTKDKQARSYSDALELEAKIDEFQYVTISDDKVLHTLSGKIKNLPNKIKCVLEIILKSDGTSRKFDIKPSVSNEVKLTRIA
jgi:hypothetical protein